MEVNQQFYCAVVSGIRKRSGLGCAMGVHKCNSQLHDGRAGKQAVRYREGWGKVRSMKQEVGEGIVQGGGGKDKVK